MGKKSVAKTGAKSKPKPKCDRKMPRKVSMLVVRMTRDGSLAESRCCAICVSMLKAMNIDRVYFSSSDGSIVMERVKDMTPSVVTTGLLRIIKDDPKSPLRTLISPELSEYIRSSKCTAHEAVVWDLC